MKLSLATTAFALASYTYGAVCPFELLKRGGLLSEADTAKFDAVKRNPQLAEALFEAHRQEATSDIRGETSVVGPRDLDGLLDLPLGGGLREFMMRAF